STRCPSIMARLNNVLHITEQLNALLSMDITAKNREDVIGQINELVEKRGELMNQVTPPFTDEEKRIGQEVVALNKQIQAKMNDIFTELKQEMKQINKQKKSTQTYENPYEAMQTVDGMFLDQKK